MTVPIPSIAVDLARPPDQRWQALQPYVDDATRLLAMYMADFGRIEPYLELLGAYAEACVEPEYRAEMASIAALAGMPAEAVLAGNLYYDALKFVLGCTAFAVDTPDGPLHARNLDWWTENGLLSRHTLVVTYQDAARARTYQSVAWPGFIGALSGLAPGRFAVTLNAVSSAEPAAFAAPITFLLRTVLERGNSFQEAVDVLVTTEIASDCLLLVTGTHRGEMVVVERTPTRAAVRYPKDGFIVVTNEYLKMGGENAARAELQLQITSCGRFDRATSLLRQARPHDARACFRILTDSLVRMGITVQHMVMSAATGTLEVRLPPPV